MSDLLLVAIITGGFAFCSAVFTGLTAIYIARISRDQKAAAGKVELVAEIQATAARKVEQVAQTLETSTADSNSRLDALATVAEATHTLVNNNMAQQLKLNAAVTRRLANMTNDPMDIEAADLAQQLSEDHQRKQALVDAQAGTADEKAGKNGH